MIPTIYKNNIPPPGRIYFRYARGIQKAKIWSRCTKHKKGRNRAYNPGNSTIYKGRQKEMDKEMMKIQNNQKANEMAMVSSYVTIIILNVNRLNSSNKRQRVAE